MNSLARVRYPSAKLSITNICNFKCLHCYNKSFRENDKVNMSKSLFSCITEKFLEAGVLDIMLTGGEPLAHPNFVDIWEQLYKLGFKAGINTNLYLLTEKHIEIFKKYPPLCIIISLYGFSNDAYKEFTSCHIDIEELKFKILSLKDIASDIIFKYILTKPTLYGLPKAESFCRTNISNCFFHINCFIEPALENTYLNDGEFLLEPKIAAEAIFSIDDIKKQYMEIFRRYKNKTGNLSSKIFKCASSVHGLVVTHSGDVTFCDRCIDKISFRVDEFSIKEGMEEIIYPELAKIENRCCRPDQCLSCPAVIFCKNCYYTSIEKNGSFEYSNYLHDIAWALYNRCLNEENANGF